MSTDYSDIGLNSNLQANDSLASVDGGFNSAADLTRGGLRGGFTNNSGVLSIDRAGVVSTANTSLVSATITSTQTTASGTPIDVPGLSITFTVSLTKTTNGLLLYSHVAGNTSAANTCHVQLLIDGSGVPNLNWYIQNSQVNGYEQAGAAITPIILTLGSHTIKAIFDNSGSGTARILNANLSLLVVGR